MSLLYSMSCMLNFPYDWIQLVKLTRMKAVRLNKKVTRIDIVRFG